MELKLIYHGTMFSDYFHGTNGVWLNTYPDKKSTIEEQILQLEDEINAVWEHIEYTAAYHEFTGDLEKEIDRLLSELKENNKGIIDEEFNSDLDYDFDDCEDMGIGDFPVAIWTIEFIK